MNIAIIGSGGREHSICFKLKQSKKVKNLFCIPGNAGTSKICHNLNIEINNFEAISEAVIKYKIDLVIVGPEEPLVRGIVDFFEKKGVKIFGPNKLASQLEGSKIFMKNLCEKFDIPTAKFKEILDIEEASVALKNFTQPIVIKSDGLAAGKGVTICKNNSEALKNIKEILDGKFKSSSKVIIEEFLEGEEASYFIISDGENYIPIGTAQDHKRIGEKDTGPNTGGMGAYSPSPLITTEIEEKIKKKIIEPTLYGMNKLGIAYKGILYAGLMIKNKEPYLIEYNIRFGDPECQVLMMRIKNDLLELILSTFDKSLKNKKISWVKEPAITIVAASKGYPGDYLKNIEIKNIEDIKSTKLNQLFHAGTKKNLNGKLVSSGGRVLNATVVDQSLQEARNMALKMLDDLDWKNKYYRRDIGFKILDK